jgi:hypothetical protein
VITTGLPSPRGNCNLGNEGALEPILGTGAVSTGGGDFQDASSCWNVIDATTNGYVAWPSIKFSDFQGIGSDHPVADMGSVQWLMRRVGVGLWQERNMIEVVGRGGVALELVPSRIETFWRYCKESFSAKMNNLHYATGVYRHCLCKSSTDA